jgi:AAA family ATP:ADP antiporter
MSSSRLARVCRLIVEVRAEELPTTLLMFGYAFLAMTSYNIVQPLTRSKLIASLGAVNIPYVLFASSLVIGVVMLAYTRFVSLLPRRWALPIVQSAMALVMVGFWVWFQYERDWASVAFYLWGLILAVLLVSQFWTLANAMYDPRQAKRLFGFIGGGVTLGGATGAAITAALVERLGTNTLLLVSALVLGLCVVVSAAVLGREGHKAGAHEETERGMPLGRALALVRGSRQIQLIALVIAFGSLGAMLIDQQLNMATELFRGPQGEDAIGAFLAQVRLSVSIAGTVAQVWLTPLIHRYLGIAVALMVLPTGLAATALVILATGSLWAPAAASILDRSVRYTVDKTTREVLFLPLPAELRQQIKPLVDVTVDRLARGMGSVVLLALVQPWGLGLRWSHLSAVSLGLAGAWFVLAVRAKRGYVAAFRATLGRADLAPKALRLPAADLTTIETLIEELASPDEERVLSAIELLEALDKRRLVTPLLLSHQSARVKVRALEALTVEAPQRGARWLGAVEQLAHDPDPEVRAAALEALARGRHESVLDLARVRLTDPDPRAAAAAAAALATSPQADDRAAAERTLEALTGDLSEQAATVRRDIAALAGRLPDLRFRHLLVPLLIDPHPAVAEEALRSVARAGAADFLFVPALVGLLRHRRLKSRARAVLASYGEEVLDALGHFLRDPGEDRWVRRHLPATIARIPCQKAMDLLASALGDPDGFLRYKVVAAMERLHQARPDLAFDREAVERLALKEAMRYYATFALRHDLTRARANLGTSLLARALDEKLARITDRLYRLLGLLVPWRDLAAARWALEHGDGRLRASAVEYLDNTLTGVLRSRVLPILEGLPVEQLVRRAHTVLRQRPRELEETLLQLINDEDEVVAALGAVLVAAERVWQLAGDLEHVLQYRDARDWVVFEAASWALAAHRMPETRRRTLWREPLPTVEVAAQIGRLPVFAGVSVDELVRLAAAGRQVRYEPGEVLQTEGAAPERLLILLDGRAAGHSRSGAITPIEPPAALGLRAILERRVARQTVRALDPVVGLVMSADEWESLVADNPDLLQGLFRTWLADPTDRGKRLLEHPGAEARWPPSKLSPIERALVLGEIPFFRGLAAEDLLILAEAASEQPIAPGATLFTEADPPAIAIVLSGVLALEGHGAPTTEAGPGCVLGVVETLAGCPRGRRGVGRAPGALLALAQSDLREIIEERPSVLQHVVRALGRPEVG